MVVKVKRLAITDAKLNVQTIAFEHAKKLVCSLVEQLVQELAVLIVLDHVLR